MNPQRIVSSDIAWRVGWTIVHSLWQGTAAAIVLAIVLRFIRRHSPLARYIISLASLGTLLLAAALTWKAVGAPAVLSSSAIELDVSTARLPVETPSIFATPPKYSTTEIAPPTARKLPFNWALLRSDLDRRTQPILPWLACIWAIGVALLGLRQAGGWIAIQRLRVIGVHPVDHQVSCLARRLAERLAVRCSVSVVRSLRAQTPMVIGWLRPIVLLPAAILAELTPEQIEAILAHELAHIRRHDYLVNLFQAAAETLVFYHPAVWWISKQIRIEREQCCDDLAVAICGDRYRYVESLTALEEVRMNSVLALAARGSNGSELLARIRRLILPMEDTRRSTARGAAVGIAMVVLAITIGACVHHAAAPTLANEDAWPLYAKAAARVTEGYGLHIQSPAASNNLSTDYPPFTPEWYAMEKSTYEFNASTLALARDARRCTSAHWPPVPDIEKPNCFRDCRRVAFEVIDAAMLDHVSGNDAVAVERIRDILHMADLMDGGSSPDANQVLVASGLRQLAMSRLIVITSGVLLTEDPKDSTRLQVSVARELIPRLFNLNRNGQLNNSMPRVSEIDRKNHMRAYLMAEFECRLVAMSLACHLFNQANGRWPVNVDEVTQYLPAEPTDASGKMGYVLIKSGLLNGADRPLVYSRWESTGDLKYCTNYPCYHYVPRYSGETKVSGQFRDVESWSQPNENAPETMQTLTSVQAAPPGTTNGAR